MALKLFVDIPGFVPIESNVSATCVSGIVELKAYDDSNKRVEEHLRKTSQDLLDFVRNIKTEEFAKAEQAKERKKSQHSSYLETSDPVSAMLSSTFKSSSIDGALKAVLQDNQLLGTKVLAEPTKGGLRATDGVLKSTLPTRPRGAGSGGVYDAGGKWMATAQGEKVKAVNTKRLAGTYSSSVPNMKESRIVEGLKIPPTLDAPFDVNFVVTQEVGKLKPKDLKVAIERSRAEKEQRVAEQQKMRDEGGGAGLLDLRSILSEEMMNAEDSDDPFQKQLREMAFLADVDELAKAEIEKGFRVSEESIGSTLLSPDDVSVIMAERSRALMHKKRSEWRKLQSRQLTEAFPPESTKARAGAPANISRRAAKVLAPSFDPNRNDLWAVRMNTLKRFVSLVSRWIIRSRVKKNYAMVKSSMDANGVRTVEDAKKWVADDNANKKIATAAASREDPTKNIDIDRKDFTEMPKSVAEMVCSQPDEKVLKRIKGDYLRATVDIDPSDDCFKRRYGLPVYNEEIFPEPTAIPGVSETFVMPEFRDITYIKLKEEPEWSVMGYEEMPMPANLFYFPTFEEKDPFQDFCPEEGWMRPPADDYISIFDLEDYLPAEPESLKQLRDFKLEGDFDDDEFWIEELYGPTYKVEKEHSHIDTPLWMTAEPSWDTDAIDFFKPREDLRVYSPRCPEAQCDAHWPLRPASQPLDYDESTSVRTKWLSSPGFLAVHTYLLGRFESRSSAPPPPPGPTLTDFYLPDCDRHVSGLFCFAKDHMRSLLGPDLDVAPLRKQKDPTDQLTDSESDDEGGPSATPSISLVRRILNREVGDAEAPLSPMASPARARSLGAAPASPATSLYGGLDTSSRLADSERKDDQIELLRDRKTIDLESTVKQQRFACAAAIAKKLARLSDSSLCSVQRLQVQLPFHLYADEVLAVFGDALPELPNSFVETQAMMTGTISKEL